MADVAQTDAMRRFDIVCRSMVIAKSPVLRSGVAALSTPAAMCATTGSDVAGQ
jgi:hypothetical protein